MLSEATDEKPVRSQKNPMGTHQPPKVTESLPCPRCESTSTKFCYYNNYNLSQPRYFCKSCRRYWTHGGTLRNIPIGGGTRKNSKRNRTGSGSAAVSSSCSSTVTHERVGPQANPASAEMGLVMAATDVNLNESVNVHGSGGSFTNMLNMQQIQGQNFLGLGGFHGYEIGSGLEELELGFGTTTRSWEIPGPSGASSGCNTWQLMNGDDHGCNGGVNDGGGGDDCFGWSDLAISTPAMKGFK